ncbi:MAG TPA: gamma-glutamyltransferase family protein [Chloroflexota bacterium]|jgi:gamma-glutamyltranspeptidase/glutathione hydrolase|nr:gamma-glutamyltransferase family protein [Chloroflexota bacterium]
MAGTAALPGPHGGAHRPPVTGANGVVSSAHYLASLAGARALMDGGNAVDAAVATAATLNVVEPFMSGMAGVGYMMLFSARTGEHLALDFMGRVPQAADRARIGGAEAMRDSPQGMLVPGNLGGWLAALERFGTMDRAAVFATAISYAENGCPVGLRGAELIGANADRLRRWGDGAPYLRDGRPPRHGERIVQRDLARSFRRVVEGGAEAFYRGDLGRAVAAAAQAGGGFLSTDDLAAFQPEWLTPIEADYRGHTVRTLPPPCSGLQFLIGLGLLEGFDLTGLGHNSAEHLHLFIEATKLAVADRIAYAAVADPPVEGLLAAEYLAERRRLIDRRRAAISGGERYSRRRAPDEVRAGTPRRTGFRGENTTHFSVVDREGNAVSVTQTLGGGFGCGVVAPGTGLALNNVGFWIDLDPESPAGLRPGMKMEVPMAPTHVLRDGRMFLAIGTPGGVGILQTTHQMISNVVDFGLNVQAAIEAPRIRCALPAGEDPAFFTPDGPDPAERGSLVRVEDRVAPGVREELTRRGHRVDLLGDWSIAVGGGQGVLVDPETGARSGGADPRRDGYAIAY